MPDFLVLVAPKGVSAAPPELTLFIIFVAKTINKWKPYQQLDGPTRQQFTETHLKFQELSPMNYFEEINIFRPNGPFSNFSEEITHLYGCQDRFDLKSVAAQFEVPIN